MRKLMILGLLATALAAVGALTAIPAAATVPGANGRIAFDHNDRRDSTQFTYTVNPDGSHQKFLYHGDITQWSPDGSKVSGGCCGDAAVVVNVDTGSAVGLPMQDPNLFTFCVGAWSPDGTRLSCEGDGVTDPSLNGIYTIRSSDGGGLTRVTSNPGGVDGPGDYSPDGKRFAFIRADVNGNLAHYVVNADGSGVPLQITPTGMILSGDGGSWSPTGNQILFSAHASNSVRSSLWVVNADGSGLQQIPVAGCGGAFSDPNSICCHSPSWSPDGQKIVFTRFDAHTRQSNIYTINADGSGLFQVTNSGSDDGATWGTHPLAH